MASSDLLLVAGEASGDLHGAALLGELQLISPDPSVFGLGGDRLRSQGMETVADFSTFSVVGLGEVLRALPRARKVFKNLLQEVDRRRPEVAVLIDFPEFNLRLARELKKRGVTVVYYVSPQVWAWRRGRLRSIAEVVDKMLVFFDFEVEFYEGSVDAVHVGHPLVEEVPQKVQVWDQVPAGGLPEQYTIALLPGSRSSEIDRLLPVLLGAAQRIAKQIRARFILVRAPSVQKERLESAIAEVGVEISIECSDRFDAIAKSHLALCASGTATLEVGLIGSPMIVVYRVGFGTYLLGRMLVRIPNISLANLVLGGGVITELIQRRANPYEICQIAIDLLTNRERIDSMRSELSRLRPLLGERGASRRAAEQVALTMRAGSARE